jgi:hypothetical protein
MPFNDHLSVSKNIVEEPLAIVFHFFSHFLATYIAGCPSRNGDYVVFQWKTKLATIGDDVDGKGSCHCLCCDYKQCE